MDSTTTGAEAYELLSWTDSCISFICAAFALFVLTVFFVASLQRSCRIMQPVFPTRNGAVSYWPAERGENFSCQRRCCKRWCLLSMPSLSLRSFCFRKKHSFYARFRRYCLAPLNASNSRAFCCNWDPFRGLQSHDLPTAYCFGGLVSASFFSLTLWQHELHLIKPSFFLPAFSAWLLQTGGYQEDMIPTVCTLLLWRVWEEIVILDCVAFIVWFLAIRIWICLPTVFPCTAQVDRPHPYWGMLARQVVYGQLQPC